MGNINSIVDINGKTMVKYYYNTFCEPLIITLDETDEDYNLSLSLSKCNVFLYKGYIYDVETNLALVSSRYYSPELGRFIQPEVVSSLNPQSINDLNLYTYTYALNNPISITYSTFSVGRSASSEIGSFPIGNHSNSTTGSSNSNSSGPTFGNIFKKAKSTYDVISKLYGVYVSGSTILDNMYFIKNIKPFADDMKMMGVSFRKGVLSFNDFNWKIGKGDFIALGTKVFADMYDSYQRGVSTEGIILGGALTAAKGVGMIYLNKSIMCGATSIGSCFGPVGTVVGFVAGGVVCIVIDLFLDEWLDIDEWIDSVAK